MKVQEYSLVCSIVILLLWVKVSDKSLNTHLLENNIKMLSIKLRVTADRYCALKAGLTIYFIGNEFKDKVDETKLYVFTDIE